MKKSALIALLSIASSGCYAMEQEASWLTNLPTNAKKKLIGYLAESTTLEGAVSDINSLAFANVGFTYLIANRITAEFLVNYRSQKFGENPITIAALLGSPGAVEWLNNRFKKYEKAKRKEKPKETEVEIKAFFEKNTSF